MNAYRLRIDVICTKFLSKYNTVRTRYVKLYDINARSDIGGVRPVKLHHANGIFSFVVLHGFAFDVVAATISPTQSTIGLFQI